MVFRANEFQWILGFGWCSGLYKGLGFRRRFKEQGEALGYRITAKPLGFRVESFGLQWSFGFC